MMVVKAILLALLPIGVTAIGYTDLHPSSPSNYCDESFPLAKPLPPGDPGRRLRRRKRHLVAIPPGLEFYETGE
jgi:hypothetical protein